MGSALDYGVWLANEPHAARPLIGRPVRQRAGAQMLSWSHMRKQPNGTFGKNPGAIGQGAAGPGASTADDAEPGRRPKPVRRGRVLMLLVALALSALVRFLKRSDRSRRI